MVRPLLCFQHTYEGLKQCPIGLEWNPFKAFSAYLWGIETFPQGKYRFDSSLVFSIPMRDWNIWNYFPSHHETPSFSAYLWGIETFSSSYSFGIWFCGFQHTYEGLKLGQKSQDFRRFGGFQHTYEGLKLFQGLINGQTVAMFSAYLWGIETLLKAYNQELIDQFSAYLWGIETGEGSAPAPD